MSVRGVALCFRRETLALHGFAQHSFKRFVVLLLLNQRQSYLPACHGDSAIQAWYALTWCHGPPLISQQDGGPSSAAADLSHPTY